MDKPSAAGSNIYAFPRGKARDPTRDARRNAMSDLSDIIAAQSEIASAGLDLNRVVDAITRKAQVLTGSTGAVVEMLSGSDLVYWSGSGSVREHIGLRIPALGSLSGLCVAKGALLVCTDSESDPRVNIEACRKVGLRSALVMPLHCEGELVGVLKVLSNRANAYTQRHVALIETLASFIGSTLNSALEHAKLHDALARGPQPEPDAKPSLDEERASISDLIHGGGVFPVFQPIVELASGRAVGFEALSRFAPGAHAPADGWFDAANRVGMCLDLETACISAIVAAVSRAPQRPGYISLNVSPMTLMEYDFGILPDRAALGGWVLEITEHSEVGDYAALAERVQALQRDGFRIAIDDAGAGYASLRHVLRLSPDIVKLDISITRDIDKIVKHQQLAAAIITFSHDTGIELVAEGIETEGERDTLAGLHVPYGQGYLFGKPVPLASG